MTRLDHLPPDQRAALSLLLSQGKDYAQVAALLRIDERAVHDRAHAAIAALAVAVVLIVVLSGGGSGRHAGAARAGSSTAASSSSASTPRADETKRLTLLPTNPSSKAVGVVAVLAEGSTYAYYLAAEHLQPSQGFFYAVWLYNSPSSYEALSKSPPVGADGRMQGGSLLPSNAASYHQMILTRETV